MLYILFLLPPGKFKIYNMTDDATDMKKMLNRLQVFTFRDNAKNLSLFNQFLEFLYDLLREHLKKNEFSLMLHQRSHPQRKPSSCCDALDLFYRVYRRTSNTAIPERLILPQFQFFMERQGFIRL